MAGNYSTYVDLGMARTRAPSQQTIRLLEAFATAPSVWRHGYDLMTEVRVSSGSLYPILARLADRGLLESSWDTSAEGRPPRHLYRLTALGEQEAARAEADAVRTSRRVRTHRAQPMTGRAADAAGGA
jgi:DNA-binding PadR family transcriptional regulator